MKCPNGHDALERKTYKGVTIDECPVCKGRFFDKGELTKAKNSTEPDLRFLDFDLFSSKNETSIQGKKQCPKDNTIMHVFNYPGSKVEIDTCPKCFGVWLDHGEFERIISYLIHQLHTTPSGQMLTETEEELKEVFSPEKPVDEEIKDFLAVSRLLEMRYVSENPILEKILSTYYTYTPLR